METTRNDYRPRANNWTVTLFGDYLPDKITLDPNGTPLQSKEAWFKNPQIFKYAIFGRETCPDTKKPHLQGFVACYKQQYLTQMKKLFPDGKAHFEIAQGTPKHNKDYCSKVLKINDYL